MRCRLNRFIETTLAMILVFMTTAAWAQNANDAGEANPTQPKSYTHLEPLTISDVSAKPQRFNPSSNETTRISMRLSRPGSAGVQIYDADRFLISEIEAHEEDSGMLSASWDGRDVAGNLVPDSAYSIVIRAHDYHRNAVVYNPGHFSGGEGFSPANLVHDPQRQQIRFSLAVPAWVYIRVGIVEGPLLANLVKWAPFPAGTQIVEWDGSDASGRFMVSDQTGWKLGAGAVSLQDNSVITWGNSRYDFIEYRSIAAGYRSARIKELPRQHPRMQTRERVDIAPFPTFKLGLPNQTSEFVDGLPVVHGMVPVRITLDSDIKRYAIEQRYEVMIFIDYRFVSEEDEGYSPVTRVWDSRSVPDGPHVITANVRLLGGQAEAASMRIWVRNGLD
jgi:flagellar hook capping protein FlgD